MLPLQRRLARTSVVLLLMLLPSGLALAHDDPILTIRILTSGLSDGQIDAAMGEVDDNATIFVDRQVVGRSQIQAWMEEQLRQNLRIEVVDIHPTQTQDGYSVTWTTRMYREDWRQAGVPVRQTTEQTSIHNGRVTRWTSSLAGTVAPSATSVGPATQHTTDVYVVGVPLSEVPFTLRLVLALAVLLVCVTGVQVLRRSRQNRPDRTRTVEPLVSEAKR